jgi:FeS assembly SUF system protein
LEEKKTTVSDNAAPASTASASTDSTSTDIVALRESVIDVLKSVYDPEIPVNIYELGMIYEVQISEEADVHVIMTLTSPACPVAGTLPGEVENKVQNVDGVATGKVELVWEPAWTPDKMTEAAKLQLGMM